jgi:hypothetical protein
VSRWWHGPEFSEKPSQFGTLKYMCHETLRGPAFDIFLKKTLMAFIIKIVFNAVP